MSRPARGRVLASRDFRLLVGARAVSTLGDWFYVVAFVVYVYAQTQSAAWVAAAGIGRLLPYALFSFLGGALADRFDRRRTMLVADFGRAAVMAAMAIAAASGRPAAVVIGLAFVSTTLGTAFLPAQSALIPSLVEEQDLASANTLNSVVTHLSLLLGPALGGTVLLVAEPPIAFAVNAATFAVSGLLVLAVRHRARTSTPGRRAGPVPGLVRQLGEGLTVLRGNPQLAMVVVLCTVGCIQSGVEAAVWVLVAEQRLGLGPEGLGYLLAAMGAGGILAATVAGRLSMRRTDRLLLAVALAYGLPMVALAFTRNPGLAYALIAVEGMAVLLFDVAVVTLLQRLVADHVRGRVFGLIDSLSAISVIAGLILTPVLVATAGLPVTLMIIGLLLPVGGLIGYRLLARANRDAVARADALAPVVARLRGLAILDGASAIAVEAVAASARPVAVAESEVVVAEGEPAEAVYVIISGSYAVRSAGEDGAAPREVARLGAGDYFGEIGVLHGGVRTATVRSLEAGELLRIDGAAFAEAVSLAPAVPRSLRDTMAERLVRTHPTLAARWEAT